MAQQVFADETAKLEDKRRLDKLQREKDEREQAKKSAMDTRKQFILLTVSGLIVSVVGIVATYYMTKSQVHDSAFVEGVKSVPTQAAPQPQAPAMTAPAR